jgi:dTDP-4-dehydrorhamnose 3,5-epimerase
MIEGVQIFSLNIFSSAKGNVLKFIENKDIADKSFGECYCSEVCPEAVKAWKRHKFQSQNLAVVRGLVELVIYDDRNNTSTKGELLAIKLGLPNHYNRVRIPNLLWYGFRCLSDTPALILNYTDLPHDPSETENVDAACSKIPFDWDIRTSNY